MGEFWETGTGNEWGSLLNLQIKAGTNTIVMEVNSVEQNNTEEFCLLGYNAMLSAES
jgi:hypothetical protein